MAYPSIRWLRARLACLPLLLSLAACDAAVPGVTQPSAPPVVIIATPIPASPGVQPTLAPTTSLVPSAGPSPTAALPPPPTTAAPPTAGGEPLLERVKNRGRLLCGTNADLPGFGFYDNVRQRWSGFDVDFCRAVAAAVLGDASAVEFVALDTSGANERFAAVREGRADLLIRNTTWTLGRDIAGLAFGPTTFHDGQTFMVRSSSGIGSVEQLAGKRVCVARGTTSEQNLRDDFGARGIAFQEVLFDDENQLYPAYDRGECDAVTSDSSQLASKRETLAMPTDHLVLGDRISREPLGPVFVESDEQWRDVVSWVVFATMYAEELRVDQATLPTQLNSTDPRVRRLIGIESELGAGLGLPNDFGRQVIEQVGNYADIYNRNLGPDTPFALERGPNKAWNLGDGGVLASPPFR